MKSARAVNRANESIPSPHHQGRTTRRERSRRSPWTWLITSRPCLIPTLPAPATPAARVQSPMAGISASDSVSPTLRPPRSVAQWTLVQCRSLCFGSGRSRRVDLRRFRPGFREGRARATTVLPRSAGALPARSARRLRSQTALAAGRAPSRVTMRRGPRLQVASGHSIPLRSMGIRGVVAAITEVELCMRQSRRGWDHDTPAPSVSPFRARHRHLLLPLVLAGTNVTPITRRADI